MPAHRQKLLALEEALPRASLLELPDYRHAEELAALVGELEHSQEHREFAIDRAIRGALGLPPTRVVRGVGLAEPGNAPPRKVAVEVQEAATGLVEVATARHLVVLPEIGRDLVIHDAIGAREDWRAGRDGALALLE